MEVVTGTPETDVRFDELVLVSTTIAGNALAKARIGKRMERSVAEGLLRGVLDRAAEVNHTDVWLHWVRQVVLYGSLASDGQETAADVHVAVVIEPRFGVDEFSAPTGARPTTLIDAMSYAQTQAAPTPLRALSSC